MANLNLPVIELDPSQFDGWRIVQNDELIKTYYEVYRLIPRPEWHISAYVTAEKYHNNGASYYRAPASLRAWCHVFIPAIKKWFKYKFNK